MKEKGFINEYLLLLDNNSNLRILQIINDDYKNVNKVGYNSIVTDINLLTAVPGTKISKSCNNNNVDYCFSKEDRIIYVRIDNKVFINNDFLAYLEQKYQTFRMMSVIREKIILLSLMAMLIISSTSLIQEEQPQIKKSDIKTIVKYTELDENNVHKDLIIGDGTAYSGIKLNRKSYRSY